MDIGSIEAFRIGLIYRIDINNNYHNLCNYFLKNTKQSSLIAIYYNNPGSVIHINVRVFSQF